MAYNNYAPPPGAYPNQPPGFNAYGANGPPGMVAPFPMGAPPGMDGAPGMTSQSPPNPMSAQFQPPPNMSNINFNASVIRMGLPEQSSRGSAPGGPPAGRDSNAEPLGRRDRGGPGPDRDSRNMERERAMVRESMMALHPPTREEVARTIFVGGLKAGAPSDDAIESILRCAGKLRRWIRARDADDKRCKFGFAEYEDVDSLEAATEILVDVQVPVFTKTGAIEKDEDGETKKMNLLVVVDDASKDYINEWKGRRKEEDEVRQFRLDGCKEDLRQTLTAIANAGALMANAEASAEADGDTNMANANGEQAEEGDVVNIPLDLEDELADIPADMRATVAEEIKAFRDRSNRRDIERLRREEEMEQAEKMRGSRYNRLASPGASAPSGPASAANGIPVGPRDRAAPVQGAPSGPRGYRGAQIPNDYVNGVSFVGANGVPIRREDEDAEESDEELERRRQAKKDAEVEKQYLDLERRLHTRERTRAAAQEREKTRSDVESRDRERAQKLAMKRFQEWDDDVEAKDDQEEYYFDRSSWLRRRAAYRDREEHEDAKDRAAEDREKAEERRRTAEARGRADDFLDQTGNELEQRAAEQPSGGFGGFKMSLGSAAAKTRTAAQQPAPRRAMADVEGLLDDEEDAAASGLKRPELRPLTDTSTIPVQNASDMTAEQIRDLKQQIAAEIPTATSELFAYPVKFNYLSDAIVDQQIRPFVEKKVVEYLGVQEDFLVETVVDGLKAKREASAIVSELEDALEDEAELLVRKAWRMVVFCTEMESRGL